MGANPALTFAEQASLGGLEKLAATAAAGRLPLWSGPASWRALRRSRFTPPVSCLRNFYSGWIPRSACVSHRCSRRMRAFVSGRPLRRLPRPESFCRHLWRQACADPREVRSHEKIYRHQCIQGTGHGAGSPAASRHCRSGAGGWSAGARTGSVRCRCHPGQGGAPRSGGKDRRYPAGHSHVPADDAGRMRAFWHRWPSALPMATARPQPWNGWAGITPPPWKIWTMNT